MRIKPLALVGMLLLMVAAVAWTVKPSPPPEPTPTPPQQLVDSIRAAFAKDAATSNGDLEQLKRYGAIYRLFPQTLQAAYDAGKIKKVKDAYVLAKGEIDSASASKEIKLPSVRAEIAKYFQATLPTQADAPVDRRILPTIKRGYLLAGLAMQEAEK